MTVQPSTEYPSGGDDAQVYYDVNSSRLGIQLDSVNALDSKGAALFSTGSAVIALVMAVITLRADNWTDWVAIPLGLAVVASLSVGVLTVKAMWVRTWKEFPPSQDTWELFFTHPGEGRWIVASTLSRAWALNERPLQVKTRLTRRAQYALAAETVFGLATLVIIAGAA